MTATMTDARAAVLAALRRTPEPEWLGELRTAAFAEFGAAGFPSTRDEAWRHTDLKAIVRGTFAAPAPARADAARTLVAGLRLPPGETHLLFVNGRPAGVPAGVPPGAIVTTLSALVPGPQAVPAELGARIAAAWGRIAPAQDHAFTALATALAADGVVIAIPAGRTLEAPLRIVFVTTAQDPAPEVHTKVLVLAGENARCAIEEIHAGEGAAFTNGTTEIEIASGARVAHTRIQMLPQGALNTGRTVARIGRDARFDSLSLALGGSLARNEVEAWFEAPGGEAQLDGLYAGGREQHLDNQTFVDHAHPNCSSRQLYKGILSGRGHGVFNGRVVVRPGAQGTSAHQKNRNVLLTETALADAKPQLEIFADDVQCTHGATIGRLDDKALFYLRSRGVGPHAAQRILAEAFARETLRSVEPAAARSAWETWLEPWLAAVIDGPAAGGGGAA